MVPADHGGDFLERQLEHVVEHERQPLGRGQGIKHDEESQADRVGQQCLLIWLDHPIWADDGVGQVHLEGFLAPAIA